MTGISRRAGLTAAALLTGSAPGAASACAPGRERALQRDGDALAVAARRGRPGGGAALAGAAGCGGRRGPGG